MVGSVMAGGGGETITHDYATPIEVVFDPATGAAWLNLDLGRVGPSPEPCHWQLTALYEKLEPSSD